VPFKVVLHDVPDYNERHKLLEGLKNKLEAILSPKLVSAFNSHSLGIVIPSYILEIFLYIQDPFNMFKLLIIFFL
jgi:hypothetical protein